VRKFCTAVARTLSVGMLVAFAGSTAAQQPYPNRQIRIIVPYPPGASNDAVARLVGQKLAESWGQQVIVDNRPGGNTVIGSDALVKSKPDGYTIMLTSNAHIINPHLFPVPYDPFKDFVPITTTTNNQLVLALNPSLPANNLQGFMALAKSRPGQLNYASTGTGAANHLAGELFNIMVGAKMQHIPYKGGGPALTDLVGGQVHLAFLSPLSVIPHAKSGKLKVIATSGNTRMAALPEVPTFTEAGLPGFDVAWWHGVFAPAGTAKGVIDRLASEIARILAMPEVREKLVSQGMEPLVHTPEEFAELMKADSARFGKVIKIANIKLEN
jgi:tripartite-type tricarboxylate transporter receptor subunit TctC